MSSESDQCRWLFIYYFIPARRAARVFLRVQLPRSRINTIFKRSSQQIYNVTIFFLFFLCLYGIMGVQFFGEMMNHCVLKVMEIMYVHNCLINCRIARTFERKYELVFDHCISSFFFADGEQNKYYSQRFDDSGHVLFKNQGSWLPMPRRFRVHGSRSVAQGTGAARRSGSQYTFFYKRHVYKRLSLDFRQKLRTN